ncbi:MAG TPA: TetR/AcrR family transcriptional regulator [Acidimicrobiales bacterium]
MKQAVRRPYAVGIKRREEILEAALDLFSMQGYRGTPIADIAAKVGLSVAGVLHYFSSKEELLAAVLKRRDSSLGPWFDGKWLETGSFCDAIHELMYRSVSSPQELRLFVTLSAESTDQTHPSHTFFQERYRMSRRHFTEVMAVAKKQGEIIPEASGPLLMAVLDGLQIQWLLDPSFDILGELDQHLESIKVASEGIQNHV